MCTSLLTILYSHTMSSPVPQDTMSSLRRALSLLDAFSTETRELTIRELALRSGIARSTTHRLAQELVAWGALDRTPRGLRLGTKLFELGTMTPDHTALRDVAVPYLHTLHAATGLTANLAVREGDHVVYLEKISSSRVRVPHTRVGGRGALHATALGKAILAFTPDLDLQAIESALAPLTSATLTSTLSLSRDLRRVRASHVAFDVEESQPGLFCVAAPIIGERGRARAAISLTGNTALVQAQRFAPMVLATSVQVSRDMSAAAA